MKLSVKQIKEMRHAIGDDFNRKGRNHFNTRIKVASWDELVVLGLATMRDLGSEMGGVTYHVTKEGAETLRDLMTH